MPKGKPHKIAAPASNAAIASEEDVQMEEEEEDKEEDVDDEGEEYEVEKILDHRRPRGRRGAYQFRLKWKGYLESESTWEDKSALDHCQELLLEYAEMNDLTL
ncbi:hypothetical protein EDD21DRAFT_390346 [Dissophora ornata]|nr:hypothetical protein EDD21DRAFT_390346 [Dissophora ornata]